MAGDVRIDYTFSYGFERAYKGDLAAWQEAVRAKLLEAIRYDNTPSGEFRVVETQVTEIEGIRRKRHMVEPIPWPAQPIYEIEPLRGWNGVTLSTFHGHGSDPFLGLFDYVYELARRGYRVIMPILFDKMERETRGMPYESDVDAKAVCASWSIEADALGVSLLGIRLFDAMLAYKFARTLPDVDSNRIGSVGLYMGGQLALYLPAIVTDIKCSISAGFLCTFRSGLLDLRTYCQCYSIPGWPQLFDIADIAGCVAPHPLQIQKGNEDGSADPADVSNAFAQLKRIYEASGAPHNVEYVTYPGGHTLNVEKAEEWLRLHIDHSS